MPLNQKGMSILAVLAVTSIVGISTLSILTVSNNKRKILEQANVLLSANLVKQKLVGMILSPQSWQITQTNNTQAFTNFSPSVPPTLNIYTPDSSGSMLYYQPTNPGAGFDLKGNTCTQFNINGNDACPLRYDITLKNRVFQNGNWIDTLHFELSFAPASPALKLNAKSPQLTFDLVRNLNDLSVESACVSISGVYNAAENSCSVKVTKEVADCVNGTTYRGPATNAASSNCDNKAVPAASCAGNWVVKGFNNSGNPVCGESL
ncbi:MAG: type II secretion system protein [Bdellovibrionaceae bacterium]|nr:type II secretion system protein [Pseudobdellovibrionaceae bacterium]